MDEKLTGLSDEHISQAPQEFSYSEILAELSACKRQNNEIKHRNQYLEQIIEINNISTLDTLVDSYFLASKEFYKKLVSALMVCEYDEKKREKVLTLINYYQNLIAELKKFL